MPYSPTPALQPIVPAVHLRMLRDEQLEQFKAATLEILETVGVHCPSPQALAIYADHGARVDPARQVVQIPAQLVRQAMARAPRFYTMAARAASHDLRLDGTAMYCATDGCGVETIDPHTRQRRTSRQEDVAMMARVADALPSIGFYWPMVSAQDHPTTAPLHELEASFNSTVKHVQTETVMGEWAARYAVEMAQVIAGQPSALRARPPLSLLVCTIAPLAHDRAGLEAALVFAAAGLPVGFMSMANTGSTAPATLAGTLALADAEVVSALVLVQLAYPGAPVFHSLMPGMMHPRTGAYLSTALEGELSYVAGVELAHMWGLPALAGVFGTDAPEPGWQAATEAASCLTLCALCGAEMGSGLGLAAGCTVLYPEALLLDSDIYHRVRLDLAGLDTSREALALDVIRQVGPRGNYLRQRHTRDHLRRRQLSELTAQPGADGYRDPLALAREKTGWIVQNHHPEPLRQAQRDELARIVRAADRERGDEPLGGGTWR